MASMTDTTTGRSAGNRHQWIKPERRIPVRGFEQASKGPTKWYLGLTFRNVRFPFPIALLVVATRVPTTVRTV